MLSEPTLYFQYQDAVTVKTIEKASTPAQAYKSQAILWQICRNLKNNSYFCSKTAEELSFIMRISKADMSRALDFLESIGALKRERNGRSKTIILTPESMVFDHGLTATKHEKNVPDQMDIEDYT